MALVFRAAVEEAEIEASIFHVSAGDQALAYLRRGTIRPDLVFLDLNMPRVDGWQVLTAMRADENLRAIPVVVLSTSFRPADRDRAYSLGAMHYITKPFSFEALVIAVRSVYRKLLATRSASVGARM
jgi:CheY-like chemotaxis protein